MCSLLDPSNPALSLSLYTKTAVGTSISQQERLDAIQKAKASFAHSVQMVHDEEIVAGADAALTKHLTFLLWQSKHADVACELAEGGTADGDDDPHVLAAELGMACEAMESLFQASSVTVGASFRRMGRDILRLLVTILDNEINRRLQSVSQHMAEVEREKEAAAKQGQAKQSNDDDDHHYHEASAGNSNEQSSVDAEEGVTGSDLVTSEMKNTRLRSITPPVHDDLDALIFTQEGDLLLQKVTRILGHFARVGDATKPMAHFPGLLGCLISLITFHPYDNVPWEARLSSLWTIANLGCNPENMRMMVCCPRLVESLIEVASRPLHPSDSLERTMELLRSRSISSRVILNLSWAPETKIILSENATLIDLLAELSVHRNAPLSRSQTVKEILLTTRRYALGALRNLAAATRQVKIGLCDHKNGHLLDILTDAALNDADIMVKEYAFATIHNLATHDSKLVPTRHALPRDTLHSRSHTKSFFVMSHSRRNDGESSRACLGSQGRFAVRAREPPRQRIAQVTRLGYPHGART